MSDFTVRPTLASDAELMAADGGPWDADGRAALSMTNETNWFVMEKSGAFWTALRGEKIVAVCGFIVFWPGYARLAAIFHNRCKPRDFFRVHREAQYKINLWQDVYGFERIEAMVDCGFERGLRWVKALGFQQEGLMRKYLNGRDHYIYAKVKDVIA